ncbi:hypothetical protein PQX77_011863 [Marasmius sp. AFHP31]|nr:hypothetical protein PQX77_011863 [Marasmius sp. AFHP31]
MPTLPCPPEVLAIVLDFVVRGDKVRGSRDMIKKCSVVSRLWCSLSRPHIFREIQIALTKDDTREWAARCKKSPHFALLITHVTLTDSDTWSDRSWGVEDAEELGRELISVQSLTLRWVSEIEDLAPHTAFLKQLGSAAGGVQSVRLRAVEFVEPGDLLLYLSSIPGAPVNLSLTSTGASDAETDMYRDNGPLAVNHPQLTLPHTAWPLRSLVLHHTELRRDVLSFLLSSAIDLSGLRSLVITQNSSDEISPSAMPLFEQFSVSVGSSLQLLTLDSHNNEVIEFPVSHLRDHLRELRQLTLISRREESELDFASGLYQLLAMLPGLQAHQAIEEIVLAVDSEIGHFSVSQWEILDRELDAAIISIPTFRRFTVHVEISSTFSGGDDRPEAKWFELAANDIRKAMPRLLARKLLVVRDGPFESGFRFESLYEDWLFGHG